MNDTNMSLCFRRFSSPENSRLLKQLQLKENVTVLKRKKYIVDKLILCCVIFVHKILCFMQFEKFRS